MYKKREKMQPESRCRLLFGRRAMTLAAAACNKTAALNPRTPLCLHNVILTGRDAIFQSASPLI
jgi:hypothetical protein